MAIDGSITQQIRDVESGRQREDAARALWDRFFGELVRHALRKLRAMHAAHGLADEEDVAARAFAKVWGGIAGGRLRLATRVDLICVLRRATTREAISQARRSRPPVQDADGTLFAGAPDEQMSPEILALAEEGCRSMLDLLGDDLLRQIALWKLVGHTNDEIRTRLGCSHAKVERKLRRIRDRWAALAPGRAASPGPHGPTGPVVDARDPCGTTDILDGLTGRS